ncbi:hypothetical protein [Flammeovirga sp. SubArs3]|uniref:hypothetical protein n=1 Tax=Flammeovirga sp. SubArs3 TaxID=2995316 RepID=UPI00248BB1A6|nr:hypothetical protein [Flammeovirga sp. SubArs3]
MDSLIIISIILSRSFLSIALINGIISDKLSSTKLSIWYTAYIGFILGIEVMILFSIYILESESTQQLYPFYVGGEFFVVINLFLSELKSTKKWQVITGIIACCFFIEAYVLWLTNNDASTGYGKIISHLTIICFAAYLLIKNINELKNNGPSTIVHAFLFLYYSVSLFLFMVMNQLTDQNIFIWVINNILSTVLYGSFVYTFYSQIQWSSKSNI